MHVPHGWPTTADGWRDLGRQLAIVHAGPVPDDPEHRLSDADRWHRCEEVVGTDGLDPELRAAFEAEVCRLDAVMADGWPRRFVHDDIDGANLLFDQRSDRVWLIDWGDAGVGDATLDLRRIPPDVTPLVLDGYQQLTPTDDGFEARVRWDQLHTTLRRAREPAFAER